MDQGIVCKLHEPGFKYPEVPLAKTHVERFGVAGQNEIVSLTENSARCICMLAAVLLLHSRPAWAAADRQPTGRDIFRQRCAKCHGRAGEGVKGKYDGPLQGERPLEKLTSYIARNMPDDAPGTCTGEEAASVARYIYLTFYSQEARLRSSKPPRIELLRLTNLQYLNSVADLIKSFTGNDATPGDERGLRAAYWGWKDYVGDKKAIERVDREINFDYSDGFPDEKVKGTNGFSMQWRGSLKPDETGEYEFILRTPNGARLWVNDESEPLIDAWVASNQISEYKAKLRLLGGRVYPLNLNYFKHKEKLASISLQWKPPHGAQQPIPGRNLVPSTSSFTLVVATPFPPDDSSLGYERGMSVSKAWDEATTQGAIEVANYVSTHLDRLSDSKAGDTNRMAKIEAFCAQFVTTAFHRPLNEAEKNRFVSAQLQKRRPGGQKTLPAEKKPVPGGKSEEKLSQTLIEDAVKRVVLLTLKSPRFLYPGLDEAKADDFEVAARLSYALWDSLPDSELRKAAERGGLHTNGQIVEQTRRMLADPRAHAKMQSFFHHWLQMDRVENLSKDDKLFPGFNPDIIADLRSSLNIFLEQTMWSSSSDYRTLLLADYLYLNNRLAQFYGLATNSTDDFSIVKLNPEQRSGVLTHPYLLAAFSYQKMTSPIHRGVFLTRNIVGRALKPPPMAMTFKDADFAPNLTMRQKVAELTRPQNCQSCHSVINPLGFSLEQYDAVGRFRTSDNDNPVDPVSDYLTDDGQKIRLNGARDVAQFALRQEQAQKAFIQQLFHHIAKQPLLAYGPDTLTQLQQSFVSSDFNMQKLVAEIVTITSLHGVEKSPRERTSLRSDKGG